MLPPMEDARARALLARTPQLGCAQLLALIGEGGEAAGAVQAPEARELVSGAAQAFLASPDEAAIAADLEWLNACGARILLCTDAEYPPLLKASPDAPAALYVRGAVSVLSSPQLAMVGTRSPTRSGRATAREFAAWFARAGLTVTSGLAPGIDAAAHAGALRAAGATIAVCGTALDRVYPPSHAALAARIEEHGALVSEVPPRSEPLREHFVRRNRIIAGLTLGTLVVEAARQSGSLITARLALDAGREVFAIPGSIHSALARGCHQLIKQGAKLVDEAADVLSELKFSFPKEQLTTVRRITENNRVLDKEYEMLLDALALEPATVESLVARTRLPAESVASMLLILELEGRVAALPGGRYGRTP
jgi:DNA processing protein